MNKNHKILFGAGVIFVATLQPVVAQAVSCGEGETLTPVKGKIFNNAVSPGTTMGTVHAMLGKEKMKCGILGQGAAGNDGSINFIHTIVCDDEVVFPPTGDTVHSQISLNTTGFANVQACAAGFPPGSTVGTFSETSIPISGTGRGVFAGMERGEIHIDGTINCLYSIDMTFSGSVCLKNTD